MTTLNSTEDTLTQLKNELMAMQARLAQLEAANVELKLQTNRTMPMAGNQVQLSQPSCTTTKELPVEVVTVTSETLAKERKGNSRRKLLQRIGISAVGIATLATANAVNAPGVQAETLRDDAVIGKGGPNGYGGKFSGTFAPLYLQPQASGVGDAAPTGTGHQPGEFYVGSGGSLYYLNGSGWKQLDTTSTSGVTSVAVTAPITNSGTATAPNLGLNVTPANSGGAVALQPSYPGTTQSGHITVGGTVTGGDTSSYTGTGVKGLSYSGVGVYGESRNGFGLQGTSQTFVGMYATSQSGAGVYSSSASNVGTVTTSGSSYGLHCTSNTSMAAHFQTSATGVPTVEAFASNGQIAPLYGAYDVNANFKAGIYPDGRIDVTNLTFSGKSIKGVWASRPGSNLVAGDRYFATDRGLEYYWDGTRWLSVQLFTLTLAGQPSPVSATAYDSCGATVLVRPGNDIYVVSFDIAYFMITGTGSWDASNYWGYRLFLEYATTPGGYNYAVLLSGNGNWQSGRGTNTYYRDTFSFSSVYSGSLYVSFDLSFLKNGNACNLAFLGPVVSYRLVGI